MKTGMHTKSQDVVETHKTELESSIINFNAAIEHSKKRKVLEFKLLSACHKEAELRATNASSNALVSAVLERDMIAREYGDLLYKITNATG